MSRRVALPLVGLLLAACGPDTNINRLIPDMAVAPESLDFGRVVIGEGGTLELQIVNAGAGPLSISDISMADGPAAAAYTVMPAQLDLDASSSETVLVTFEPDDLTTYSGELLIGSNDPERPLVAVPVTGEGGNGGPDLVLDKTSLDFGDVEVGDSETAVFTIRNQGDSPLVIEASSPQGGSGAFTAVTDPRGETIGVNGSFTVLMEYTPETTDGDEGTFTLLSNDPDDPELTVSLAGNGGGVSSYPVAIIAGPTVGAPSETVIMDGTGSYDPGGLTPLTYSWTLLEQPEASIATLSNTALSAPFLTMDTAGSYTVALQVFNTDGVASATALHTVQAIPADDVYVLLSWDEDDADLDLHLVRDDAGGTWNLSADCCWCNKNPDWGTGGDSSDDPLLALDADHGGGPESIHISDPADGEYFVRVHYFQDDGAGQVEATVRVYVAGEQVEVWRRDMTHNELWEVGYVRWPQGFVVDEDETPYASDVRGCQ
ncbi:MAG: choice-of-anchor D domain-containing protein [Alphaproteobacteria bacterium]|nr:choice-of-anchor D domain-containing protein [Alphaproteobacteria bacterium]